MNIHAFLRRNPIKFTWVIDPDYKGDFEGDHYKVTLTRKGHSFTTQYHKGFGHNGKPPRMVEVLDCLASDAHGAAQKFDDWAGDYGYDTDSRKAHATWRTCRKIRKNLIALFGYDAYRVLTEDVERL